MGWSVLRSPGDRILVCPPFSLLTPSPAGSQGGGGDSPSAAMESGSGQVHLALVSVDGACGHPVVGMRPAQE